MDSVKSIAIVAILLGVLYGIYNVINDKDSPIADPTPNLLAMEDDANSDLKDSKNSSSGIHPSSKTETKPKSLPGSHSKQTEKKTSPPTTSDFSKTANNPARPEIPKGSSLDSQKTSGPPPSNSVSQFAFPKKDTRSLQKVNTVNPKTGDFASSSSGTSASFDAKATPPTSSKANLAGFNSTESGGTPASSWNPRDRFFTGTQAEFTRQVTSDMSQAEKLVYENDFRGALKIVSRFYDDARLSPQEHRGLAGWLDPLAGKVVFSSEHHLHEPYFVRHNDTLKLLAARYRVPPELIFNINRQNIPDPQNLKPGTELKMVKGPFMAEINMTRGKLTLFVDQLYAGSFSIRIGDEPRPKPGVYRVLSKSRSGQDYTDRQLNRIAAGDSDNPYGQYFLDIGGGMAIHGSAKQSDSTDRRGCISLNAVDAEDVFNILTRESTLVIAE